MELSLEAWIREAESVRAGEMNLLPGYGSIVLPHLNSAVFVVLVV